MTHENEEHKEKMVLRHDAVEGYRPVFLVAITIGLLYLGYILYRTL